MSLRTKKLVGMLLLTAALSLYALACLYVAIEFIPKQWLIELVYYATVGVLWAFPAKALLTWIYRGAETENEASER